MQLSHVLTTVIGKSDEPLQYDVNAKLFESRTAGKRSRGRQILRMVLEFFRTNKVLHQQYASTDLNAIQWI
eukprot:2324817-Lingulodinium_polyedra.AAC.1